MSSWTSELRSKPSRVGSNWGSTVTCAKKAMAKVRERTSSETKRKREEVRKSWKMLEPQTPAPHVVRNRESIPSPLLRSVTPPPKFTPRSTAESDCAPLPPRCVPKKPKLLHPGSKRPVRDQDLNWPAKGPPAHGGCFHVMLFLSMRCGSHQKPRLLTLPLSSSASSVTVDTTSGGSQEAIWETYHVAEQRMKKLDSVHSGTTQNSNFPPSRKSRLISDGPSKEDFSRKGDSEEKAKREDPAVGTLSSPAYSERHVQRQRFQR